MIGFTICMRMSAGERFLENRFFSDFNLCPMQKISPEQFAITDSMKVGLVMSPTRLTYLPWNCLVGVERETLTASWPRSSKAWTTRVPTLPVAPNTATLIRLTRLVLPRLVQEQTESNDRVVRIH